MSGGTAAVVIVGGGLEGTAAAWALAGRGVTGVVVCERATVGSGGTGKSSGIVRCHYGVSALAAMAAASLEVFENAGDVLGAGCYDVTPDFNPVISRTPVGGLIVAAGFSGHGFKISPAVGRLVADLVTEGASTDPLVPDRGFRLSRFAEGDPLRSPHPYAGAGEMR